MHTLQHPLEHKLHPATGLPARRKLDRLAWGLGALALGWIAQGLFASEQLWPGLLLYAAAMLLFASRLGIRRGAEPKELDANPRPFSWQIAQGLRGQLGMAGMGAALVLSAGAWYLFSFETQSTPAWLAYLGSLLLFAVGVWLAEAPSLRVAPPGPNGDRREAGAGQDGQGKLLRHSLQSQGELPPSTGERTPRQLLSQALHMLKPDRWLIAILLLALFVRFFHFFSLPFGTWYDEATTGLEARHILQEPAFRPAFSMAMNQIADHLYLFALSFRLFGDNIAALRLVSVLFGVGGVLTAYLFGREYGGRKWGLLLAFLVASMRWHVNFSRIAMNGVDAPFFEFLALYLALRALRAQPGPLRSTAWLGLAVGIGLSFYTAFRLFAGVGILFGLAMLANLLLKGRRGETSDPARWQRLAVNLAVLLMAVWLAALPTTQYAWRHGQAFWNRTRNVSILQNRDDPNLVRALANNVQKHLLMFNYRGDNNGRHNLPGAPTLDRLSAILFALGIGLALARRDRASVFFLCLLLAGLLGGILTLDFEAPQSLRSIGALPAVVYFIALSLDALWSELRWSAHISHPRYSLALVFAGLGAIALSNAYTYFGPQARDEAVWKEFSTAETLVGKKMAELGREPLYYASVFFYDHAVIRFHAPAQAAPDSHRVISLLDPMPAREPPDRPVAYFIHPDEEWMLSLARQLYPTARFETLPGDSGYAPLAFMVYLEPGQVASVQGLEARYWAGETWDGIPLETDRMPSVDVTWPTNAPLPLPFAAEWNGVLYAPTYGDYRLGVEAPGQVELELDGKTFQGSAGLSLEQRLAIGNHALRLRATGGAGRVRLWWQPPLKDEAEPVPSWALYSSPVSANGLLGKYYPNSNWQGAPSLERIDPNLNVYFHLTPLPRPYSVEWTGLLDIPQSGVTWLGLRAVDQARLYVDGQLAVEAAVPDEYTESPIELEAGLHPIRITYQDLTGHSRIHLYWTPPGGARDIIPAAYLWPGDTAPQRRQPLVAPPPARELPPMELAWQATWGGSGDEPGRFVEPRDVVLIEDTVFVADTGNRRVQALNRDGAVQAILTGGEERFEEPLALVADSRGRLLVLDSPSGWIYRFEADGRPLDRMGGPAIQAYHPRGMTALEDDSLIISDTGGARLLFLDAQGNVKGQIGSLGEAPLQFAEPTDVAVDENGVYYVVEAYNQRLQRIDSQGRALDQWSIPASVAYDGPHMAWGPDGSLLMSAPEEGAILRYAPDGRLLNRWTQAGATPLCRPVGLYVDQAAGVLYVSDTACHYVHVFGFQ